MQQYDGQTVIAFNGRLDVESIGPLWRPAMHAVTQLRGHPLRFDLSAVSFCDVGGASFLAALEKAHGQATDTTDAEPHLVELLRRARAAMQTETRAEVVVSWTLRDLMRAALALLANSVAFLGEALVALAHLPARRRMLRVPDLLAFADHAGVRSLPLLVLLGYLIGLILAFQSAIPMRGFGADIFVANLVAISLVRELGPLLSAVILAGRTGSAFAAEIGTMKVNEEIDALVTMGLDPMTMLVLPRMFAVMLVMPIMTLTLDIAGMLGMATVMQGFGFPLVTIARQVRNWVTAGDLYGGLFKAVCFGLVVAAIGCRAGLGTGIGPRAVGLAATSAVVGGIVATIAFDGVFALIFYRLHL